MTTLHGAIVVGVDQSELSLHALQYAADLADALHVELVTVNVHPEGVEAYLSAVTDP